MALLSTLARQGRKLKKLLKRPTEGQKQIEPVTRAIFPSKLIYMPQLFLKL